MEPGMLVRNKRAEHHANNFEGRVCLKSYRHGFVGARCSLRGVSGGYMVIFKAGSRRDAQIETVVSPDDWEVILLGVATPGDGICAKACTCAHIRIFNFYFFLQTGRAQWGYNCVTMLIHMVQKNIMKIANARKSVAPWPPAVKNIVASSVASRCGLLQT